MCVHSCVKFSCSGTHSCSASLTRMVGAHTTPQKSNIHLVAGTQLMLQCPQVQVCFFMCMCVAMVCISAHMVSLGAFLLFSGLFNFCVFFVFLVKDRVLLGVRCYRSKVMGACPAPLSAYVLIHTAGKLGLDVTSVLGSSLQL